MKPTPKKLFLFAGEPSGDLHGGRLASQLAIELPDAMLFGVAGPNMRQQGVSGPLRMEDFEVMGFTDVIKALPRLYRHFYSTRDHILAENPDAVVLIDYPGFNLKLAKGLRDKGYKGKVIHYISPSVWAWGKERIKRMESTLDLLLTIYPFEAAHYAESPLPVEYVGSPLKQYISEYPYKTDWKNEFGIDPGKPIVALFPGSRQGELKRNLPVLLKAASLIQSRHPEILFAISAANEEARKKIDEAAEQFPSLKNSLRTIPKPYSYELMRGSACAMAKSGTVTLELALHGCPTVVFYKLSLLNRLYAKYFLKLKLPFYGIVNILAEKELFPEMIEKGLSAENLASSAESLLFDADKRRLCLDGCREINRSLGSEQASTQAAKAIARILF